MPNFICTTCGTQYPETAQPPSACDICNDERQFVRVTGQQWTTHDKLRLTNRNSIRFEQPDLFGIGVEPQFAIGQRALLVRTPSGNVLWDCVPLLDPALVEMIQGLGGISAIAISHPHFYTSMIQWSRAFENAPIYLHAANQQWVMRPDDAIVYWDGDTQQLSDGLTLIHCGGHFAGSTVLHWQQGARGRGALLTGDTIHVVADRKHVGFMYSYPNFIPLSPASVDRIVQAVAPFDFDCIYGVFWDSVIEQGGKAAVVRSAERHRQAIQDETR